MKKKITYRDGQKLNNYIFNYFTKNGYFISDVMAMQNPDLKIGWTSKVPTKLVANMKNIDKQWAKLFEEYTSLRDDLQLNHCLTDDRTKEILLQPDGKTRKFSPEGEKALKKDIKELDNSEVEIHVRITSEGIDDLTDDEKEVFNGILIPEFKVEDSE